MRKEKITRFNILAHIFYEAWVKVYEPFHDFCTASNILLTKKENWVYLISLSYRPYNTNCIRDIYFDALCIAETGSVNYFKAIFLFIFIDKFNMKWPNIASNWAHRSTWNKLFELWWHFSCLNVTIFFCFTHFGAIQVLNCGRFSCSCSS